MEVLRSTEEPDPVQQYQLRRKRIRDYVLGAVLLVLLIVLYFGILR